MALAVLWLLCAAIAALSLDWTQIGLPERVGAAIAALFPPLMLWGMARLGARLDTLHEALGAQRATLAALEQELQRQTQARDQGPDHHQSAPDTPQPERLPGARFSSRRAAPPDHLHPPTGQLALPVTDAASSAQLKTGLLIRALHFPENEADTEGFEALRHALEDHPTGQLIRAAQDVLTGLAQEGIYMDDLVVDRSRPELWRAFGQGIRGPETAALAGVRDRSCLALSIGRMRQDDTFREAVHLFLRHFDQCLQRVADTASDAELAALADTRSARAFMLLGRATGMLGR